MLYASGITCAPKTPQEQNQQDLFQLQRFQTELLELRNEQLEAEEEEKAKKAKRTPASESVVQPGASGIPTDDPPAYHTVVGPTPNNDPVHDDDDDSDSDSDDDDDAPDPRNPPPSYEEVMAQDAEALQKEQLDLLADIQEQLEEETDPGSRDELLQQQTELLQQMDQLQAAGFVFRGGIPVRNTMAVQVIN